MDAVEISYKVNDDNVAKVMENILALENDKFMELMVAYEYGYTSLMSDNVICCLAHLNFEAMKRKEFSRFVNF